MRKPFFVIVISVCLVLSLGLGLFGCKQAPKEKTFFAMNTLMTVSLYGDSALLDECGRLLASLDRTLSATDPTSEVYRLNHGGTSEDEHVKELLDKSFALARLTEGAFDPTVYPVVRAWGFTTGGYRVPAQDELTAALSKVGYERIAWKEGAVSLPQGMEIDFGGIAKGYAGDLVKRYLLDKGLTSGLLNLGGNVVAIGSKPDGTPYRIAVKDPQGEGYMCILPIVDKSVVTSGLYERYFEKDGVKYGHIVNPATGYPVDNGFLSVTVVGEDGAKCDALSTALFVMGPQKACEFAKSNALSVVMATEDCLYVSSDLSSSIAWKGEQNKRVVTL